MIVKLPLKSGKKAVSVIPISQIAFIIGRHPESNRSIESKLISLRHCPIGTAT